MNISTPDQNGTPKPAGEENERTVAVSTVAAGLALHHSITHFLRSLDGWLQKHVWLIALVITAVGFVVRMLAAIPSYLNPDEAVHFLMANKPSLAAVYQANLYNSHPPMLHVILYLLRGFGGSDFFLRLPSVLASTATLWVAFKWLSDVLGKTAGLVGLTLLAFAPEVIRLSVQVREYGILVFFMVSALYFLERAFREISPWMMALFCIMLVFSLLAHYATILFAVAMGLYALSRIVRGRLPAKTVRVWAVGQVATVALTVFLYVTHVSKLRTGAWWSFTKDIWLRKSYFRFGEDSILFFPLRQTVAVFKYLFSSDVAGVVGLLFSLAGVIFLFIVSVQGRIQGKRRDFGLLLALMFIVGCGAAFWGFYPYGGSRHIIPLAIFAIAGVSFFITRFTGKKLWPVLLAAVVLVPLWNISAHPPGQSIDPRDQRRSLMTAAMNYIRQITPSGGIVFSDHQTQLLLSRYLCGNQIAQVKTQHQEFHELSCEEYRLVRPTAGVWAFAAGEFGTRFSQMAEAYGLKPGEHVCVVFAGWGGNLADGLSWVSNVEYPGLQKFGRAISVFTVPVGSEPGNPKVGRTLDSLAIVVGEQAGMRVRTVFWPTDHLSDSAHCLANRFSNQVLSYGALYGMATPHERSFDQRLPAVAFWVFGNKERHLLPLSGMDSCRHYKSGWYRFTLAAVDSDTIAGVYLVESHAACALDSLARIVAEQAGQRLPTVLWPSDYLTDSVRRLTAQLSDRVFSYSEFYQEVTSGEHEVDEYLPVLAFWAFNTKEKHPEFMHYMDDGENYLSGGYRFTLVLVDLEEMAAVYVIEPLR